MKFLIEVLGDIFIILCCLWGLATFIPIWLWGSITWFEPDIVMRTGETIAIVLIGAIGIERLIDDLNRR